MIVSLTSFLMCLVAGGAELPIPVTVDASAHMAVLQSGEQHFQVSLCCPRVRLNPEMGAFGGEPPSRIVATPDRPGEWTCEFNPVELPSGVTFERTLHLQWDPRDGVLRKWLKLNLSEGTTAVTLDEIILETFVGQPKYRNPLLGPPQSYPLFLPGFFIGVEFPVAGTRWDGNQGCVSLRPRCQLKPSSTYESRRAVFGLAAVDEELKSFHRYVEAHRPPPKGMHFNYNSWWTSPVPFSERNILDLMGEFKTHLYQQHQVAFDSFTIDLGWSDPHSVWDINRQLFPQEFATIQAAAEAMGSRLGLWTSPSSCYPQAVDPKWAVENGYESAGAGLLSLAGPKYRTKYGTTIADYVGRFRLAQVKLDGLSLGDNTFVAGPWPTESVAAGAVEAFRAMRAANSDVWLEATYSAYASPWWLFDVNSVIGSFGDDSPHGRVPCPVYRESYTTARDFYNFLGADRLYSPIPAQEVLGIIHQSDDDFLNDAVTTILRGHAFISLYLNPKYMNESRWTALAGLMKWARDHESLLTGPQTRPLRPSGFPDSPTSTDQTMPRTPYGYAHWESDRGLILMRNPWIARQVMSLTVEASVEQPLQVRSVYPEPRIYATSVRAGQTVDIPLAPYETVVLSVAPEDVSSTTPVHQPVPAAQLADHVSIGPCAIQRVAYEMPEMALGRDFTCIAPESGQATEITASFDLHELPATSSLQLLVLLEKSTALHATGSVNLDGKEVPLTSRRSDSGFTATVAQAPESWHFLVADIPTSTKHVALRLSTESSDAEVSMWLWNTRAPVRSAATDSLLPSPECISLDSLALMPATLLGQVTEVRREAAPVERITGVFLDSVEPTRCVQGWGTLQRNRSVWEKPLNIGGTSFRRGLGTHARSEITYALDGSYRRFCAWAGPDMATHGSMVFAAQVDGVERWRSPRLVRGDQPQEVQIDLTGARELRLIVEDGGDNIMGDHADWAEAKLLY